MGVPWLTALEASDGGPVWSSGTTGGGGREGLSFLESPESSLSMLLMSMLPRWVMLPASDALILQADPTGRSCRILNPLPGGLCEWPGKAQLRQLMSPSAPRNDWGIMRARAVSLMPGVVEVHGSRVECRVSRMLRCKNSSHRCHASWSIISEKVGSRWALLTVAFVTFCLQ